METQKEIFNLLVITSPDIFPDETNYINFILDNGASAVYIRKENYSNINLTSFFKEIKTEHHQKIILPFSIIDALVYENYKPIIHFKEKDRTAENLSQLPNNATLSTSIHEFSELENLTENYKYVFYSPVFESISKPNYKPKITLEEIQKDLGNREKGIEGLIALGGVSSENILQIKNAGFNGAALLGSIWNDENPKERFLKIISKIF